MPHGRGKYNKDGATVVGLPTSQAPRHRVSFDRMGAHFSRLHLFFSCVTCVVEWVGRRAGHDSTTTCERLLATPKRRALLVGISYEHSIGNDGKWGVLEGTRVDVERFRGLLIGAYSWLHLTGFTSLGIDSFS